MNAPTVVLAGASGFIGSYLRRRFVEDGWRVRAVGRPGSVPTNTASWGHTAGIRDALEGSQLLINLAGKSVSCRYNARNRAEIFRSRTETTAELGRALAGCSAPPRDWFNASTGTIYRHAEDRPQTEDDGELGSGFSVQVAKAWEAALARADTPGTRKLPLRMSIVMGPPTKGEGGGVMRPFEILARTGLGGKMGLGTQKYSWTHVEDVYRAIRFLHTRPEIEGPVNIASPQVVDNQELMRRVRASLRAPFGIPTPAWLLEIGAALIRTETELVLKSRWVESETLNRAGFQWKYPALSGALAAIREAESRIR